MKIRNTPIISLTLILVTLLSGCAGFQHGFYKGRAIDQYLKVNEVTENFGYQRVQQIIGFRKNAIENFIAEKGYPDFIYEYKKDGREGFLFYFIEEGNAYDFVEQSWRPTSTKLVDVREFTDFEKKRFGNSALGSQKFNDSVMKFTIPDGAALRPSDGEGEYNLHWDSAETPTWLIFFVAPFEEQPKPFSNLVAEVKESFENDFEKTLADGSKVKSVLVKERKYSDWQGYEILCTITTVENQVHIYSFFMLRDKHLTWFAVYQGEEQFYEAAELLLRGAKPNSEGALGNPDKPGS